MLQTIISGGLTDVIKLVVIGGGSLGIAYLKHHVDIAKVKKVEAFLTSKSTAAELTKKVATDLKEVLVSQETEDKAAETITEFVKSKGGNVTEADIKNLLSTIKETGKEVVSEVKEEDQSA
ncbi:hypothetical protein G4D61_11045 [Bacillus ginsengihumi]|uniref:Uncharacterized protein n=1 Tax=Heyndrickxia ginsengihumi TaxID=363870 RepID=A0A0A6VGD7_9BACI|nr:hypothetical protein [Heyndrickxia ginsengihumi]KHD85689.1 hypothetical protein NG54_07995 [Heyndrickxia ginsengihumi]NEY20492.1 hypothetical protein [Heyndrickxia ginsengihumi]